MDNDMAGLAFDEEYHRMEIGCGYYVPSSSAETAQATFNSVENVQTDRGYAHEYHGNAPEYHWSDASSSPVKSQDTSNSVANVQPGTNHMNHYHGVQLGYVFSEAPSSSQVGSQDTFNSIDAVQTDPEPDIKYQVAQCMVACYVPTPFGLTISNTVNAAPMATYEPALFHSLKMHFSRLCQLKDLVIAAGQNAKEHEARIKADLREMWDDNADIRPRGLKGGTARKNRSIHGSYVPFKETAAVSKMFLAHRLEVEKKDLLGRNRQEGLKALNHLCMDAAEWLQRQQDRCESLLGYAAAFRHGVTTNLVTSKMLEIEKTVFRAEILQKVDDMEEMNRAIRAEYDMAV